MKKLLIGLLALSSISAFADCRLFLKGDSQDYRRVEKIMKKKGFDRSFREDDADYILSYTSNWFNFPSNGGAKLAVVASVELTDARGQVLLSTSNRSETYFLRNASGINDMRKNQQLKSELGQVPNCSRL